MFACFELGLPGAAAADMDEKDGQDHDGNVFDGVEAESGILHGCAEVGECLPGDGTEGGIKQNACHELEVGQDGEQGSGESICGGPPFFEDPAAVPANHGEEGCQQECPAEILMDKGDGGVPVCYVHCVSVC